jgi:hypothetical protein
MQPGLDDIQQSLNKAIQLVLDIFKGVYLLGQEREPNVEINRKSSNVLERGIYTMLNWSILIVFSTRS